MQKTLCAVLVVAGASAHRRRTVEIGGHTAPTTTRRHWPRKFSARAIVRGSRFECVCVCVTHKHALAQARTEHSTSSTSHSHTSNTKVTHRHFLLLACRVFFCCYVFSSFLLWHVKSSSNLSRKKIELGPWGRTQNAAQQKWARSGEIYVLCSSRACNRFAAYFCDARLACWPRMASHEHTRC